MSEKSITLKTNLPFKSEEVSTNACYPPEYVGPKIIEEQINLVSLMFDLNPIHAFKHAVNLREPSPNEVGGWFAFPRWEAIAENYNLAVEHVFSLLDHSWKGRFSNQRKYELTLEKFQQTDRTVQFIRHLEESQEGDILVAYTQFGILHRGRSVRRATACLATDEFGLGAFANACMILTHPRRFMRWEQLQLDCLGDEFDPGVGGGFSHAPFFFWFDGKLTFSARHIGQVNGRYGSSTAFFR